MSASDLFADVDASQHVTDYRCRVKLRGLIVGGIPSDPSVIRKWLEARMDLDDQALQELLDTTVAARDEAMSAADKVDALMKSDQAPSINGFKRTAAGVLYYEGRNLKAALKEASNSAYPGTTYPGKSDRDDVGKRKGLMSTMAERIFVREIEIPLGVTSDQVSRTPGEGPAWVEERIKHVMTPQGPKSAINLVEVVRQPTLDFTLRVHDDFLPREAWAKIWTRLEDIGIGADRGRSDGTFDLEEFEPIAAVAAKPKRARRAA